jgi:hypothetical protein
MPKKPIAANAQYRAPNEERSSWTSSVLFRRIAGTEKEGVLSFRHLSIEYGEHARLVDRHARRATTKSREHECGDVIGGGFR